MRHVILPLLLLAMSGPAQAAALAGDWGGDRTMVSFSTEGATVRQDCAEGRFGPVTPDAKGGFSATGVFTAHAPGPQPGDAMGQATARYEGRIEGDTLHLTIRPAKGPAQTLTLVRGRMQKLIRCY